MEQNRFIQRNKKKILRKDTVRISDAVLRRFSVKRVFLKIFPPVSVCVYALPPVGFFRLQDIFDIHEKFRSTIFCCEHSLGASAKFLHLSLNLSYFTSKDENFSRPLTGEKTRENVWNPSKR